MSSDRLTGLDASFLHLEDASSHMHVAGVMLFEGAPPPYDELLEAIERRLALVPRYRQRLAFVPLEPGPAEVGRRPAPQPALPRALHRAALARLRGAAEGPGRPRVLPAARPRQAALGDLARRGPRGRPLRDAVEDPPRARGRHLRRGHHVRAVRQLARARRPDRHRRPLAAAPAAVAPPSCSARRCSSAPRSRPRSPRSVRAVFRGPRRVARGRCATPPSASARWRGRASTRRRPAPTTSRSARTAASPGCARTSRDVKAIKDALGGTVNDVVLATVAGALGRHLRRRGHRHRRPRAEGDGPGQRARRTWSAARSATAWPR